jgi:cytochrome c oxidase cbb3-type subunit 3
VTRKRDELLDHDADGIREFDNDLPRWWLYGFYFTIVVGVLYFVNYHVLSQPFLGDKTVAAEYATEMAAAAAAAPVRPAEASTTVAAMTDASSLAKGQAIFDSQLHPCAACHRPDLGGLVGPNLTDSVWLHGCGVGDVMASIRTGYPPKGMLPFGGGPALSDEETRQLASYILSKRGSAPPNPKPADPARDVECGAGGDGGRQPGTSGG